MDFQSAMETFAEAWVAANTKPDHNQDPTQSQALSLTRCKSPPLAGVAGGGGGGGIVGDVIRPHSRPRPPNHPEDQPLLAPKKEGFDLTKTSTGKSLPVHCVVEGVSALDALLGSAPGAGPSTPLRRSAVEADSYVIIPSTTAFRELVGAALIRLGYPHDCAAAAKGSVVIKNWKPLTFDRISDGGVATVGDILGELTTVATLRIQLLRPRVPCLQEMRDKLLRLLLVQSHGLLMSSGCPLDEVTLAQICRGSSLPAGPHSYQEPSEEIKRKFDQWWNAQVTPRPNQYSPRQPPSPISTKMERPPSLGTLPEHVHPALQTVQSQYPTQKTRMRTSFDPELELPKLQRWFSDNQHPSRQQIQQYVRELNNLESRRGRKPLDVNNVVYWFKNARAAQKRAESRSIGIGGMPCHLSLNGYNSSSHSPPNGAMMLPHDAYLSSDRLSEHHSLKSPLSISPGRGHQMSMISEDLSNGGSDVDDDDLMEGNRDDDRPETPEAPLSLITTKKEVEPEAVRRNSPKPPDIPKIDEIKQEPLSDDLSKPQDLSPDHCPVNNNNNHLDNNNGSGKIEPENNVSDDEEDEDIDQEITTDDDMKAERRMSEESLQTMHPSRVADMNRQRMRGNFRSPSPTEMIGSSGQLVPRCPPGTNLERLGFPLVPNSMFSHSIMYMSHYIPGLGQHGHNLPNSPPGSSGLNLTALAASAADERRKRNRTFIDPVTEVPRLEQWFILNTHPSHNLILKYTEELNRMPYRQKFPRLESKNVQFWFKNRRAKCKRLKMSLYETAPPGSIPQYHVTDRD